MPRCITKNFQLERDRMGMLGERNLLNLKIAGTNVSGLEAFRYVVKATQEDEMPRETTLFNHLFDEFEKIPSLKPKIEKARDAPWSSHRRSTTRLMVESWPDH